MSEERMKILDMLDGGKVNVDEAVRLLDSVSCHAKMKKISKDISDAAKNLGCEVTTAYKNVEPKLKEVGHCVIKKTADVLKDVSNKLKPEDETQ